jgi:hypothetical protein
MQGITATNPENENMDKIMAKQYTVQCNNRTYNAEVSLQINLPQYCSAASCLWSSTPI